MAKRNMYDLFRTDENMEVEGIWLDYGEFRIKVAAAGQGNSAYVKYAEKKLKPVRRALETGAMSNERAQALMADIYAVTIVKSWQVKDEDDKWKDGMHDEEGNVIPMTKESVTSAFTALPRLFMDVQEGAQSMSNFQAENLEEDSGN